MVLTVNTNNVLSGMLLLLCTVAQSHGYLYDLLI